MKRIHLISAYRDKNQIEQAFKDVKSFIKIQPFNVWEPKHVRQAVPKRFDIVQL
jgi:transposase